MYFPERFSCPTEGLISVVNITYDNYLGFISGYGSFSVSGKVAVCQNGMFVSVCDISWDENDANVLCNSIGSTVTGISRTFSESTMPYYNITLRCQYPLLSIVATPLYGLAVGADPIALESIDCTGNEPNISLCPSSPIGVVNDSMCRESNRAAGVRCTISADSCIDGQVRLVDGPGYYEGRLEVCSDNQWFSVCDDGFDVAAANSVCNNRLLLLGSKLTQSKFHQCIMVMCHHTFRWVCCERKPLWTGDWFCVHCV